MKQAETIVLAGKIRVETGLHVGGSTDSLEIGGMDNPIIRFPHTNEPYIPGSSLRGKMRSLSEWHFGRLDREGKVHVCQESDCEICRVFGSTKEAMDRGPTRLLVRDAVLTEVSREKFRSGIPVVEEKSENSINRITARANPRPIERVLPGIEVEFEMVYKVFDTGDGGELDRKYYREVVLGSLVLLEADYLGGGGSRGSGKISFRDLHDNSGNLSLGDL